MGKVLIVRFSSIGDIVLTTPVVRCIAEQTEHEVHFITKPQFVGLLENNPNITKVHSLKESMSETIKSLKLEQFDYIIDLHNNLRSAQIKMRLDAKAYSFDKINYAKWMMVNFKINRLPQVHIVDRYLDTTSDLSITNDKKGLDFFINPENEVNMSDHVNNSYVAFAIGGQHATKQLPKHKIIELIQQIQLPVVLLGGKEDQSIGEEIVSQTGAINLCGKTNLQGSASVVKQAQAVITHDTGMMHISAAFNKKIATIWGNTIPEFGMTPYTYSGQVFNFFVNGLKCRPCSKIGFKACPKKHFECMEKQDIGRIARFVNS